MSRLFFEGRKIANLILHHISGFVAYKNDECNCIISVISSKIVLLLQNCGLCGFELVIINMSVPNIESVNIIDLIGIFFVLESLLHWLAQEYHDLCNCKQKNHDAYDIKKGERQPLL